MIRKQELKIEFDKKVKETNEYLERIDNKQDKSYFLKNFIKGISSINLFPNKDEYNNIRLKHPVYSDKKLTSEQKDAIMLASDLKRIEATLEERIDIKDVDSARLFINKTYSSYRETFIAYAK